MMMMMNTKIKELLRAANVSYDVDSNSNIRTVNTSGKSMNAFIELLVQEFIDFGHEENGWKPEYMIKRHFGVSE